MQSSTPVLARLSKEKHTHLNEKQYPLQSESRDAICQQLRTDARAHLHSYVHVPLVKRALTRESCPQANAPSQRQCRQKSAVNAKRMLANISLLYHILPFTFLTQLLLPFSDCLGEKGLTLNGVISLYHCLLKQDLMTCGAFV